jgi:signal transduction histidine kinase
MYGMRLVDVDEVSTLAADRLQLLGRVSAGVVHDLSNYLAMIDASLGLAERAGPTPTGRAELMRARAVAERAMRLVKTLLRHGRPSVPALQPIDLCDLVRRTVDLVARVTPAGVSFVLELDATAPPIAGVLVELEQLLLNLILNAFDAMPKGGILTIDVTATRTSVILKVIDHGHGASRLCNASGSGLGLGIVRTIAARHEATFELVPSDPGTRAEVTFARLTPGGAT